MNQLTTQDSYLQPFFQKLADFGSKLPSLLIGMLVGILVVRLLTYLSRWLLKITHLEPGVRQVIGSVIELTLWFLLVVALLQGLGFANIILFFTSSVVAFAIIMAAGGSTLISDILAGVFIAQDKDFKVGDQVIVGPDKTTGTIELIDARRTRVRDDKGKLHILPNTLVERNEWVILYRAGDRTARDRVRRTAHKIKSAVKKAAATRSDQSNSN